MTIDQHAHQLRHAARTDRGLLRSNNQDSVFAGERLLIIADGMGGHAAGDVASRLVVDAFVGLDELPAGTDMRRPLVAATRVGNAAIAETVAANPEFDGMGTTLTALLFDGPRVALAHVGDSRAYLYRNHVLHQISHDDTFVQSLVDEGRITSDEATHHPQRSLLLRALNGGHQDPVVSLRESSAGDRFLICSDGLSDYVSPEAIADALGGEDTDEVADTLIQLALVAGAPDNVTVIVADVVDTGALAPVGAAAADADPEATGPLLAIHQTQTMPRVPLPPIPEEPAAAPDFADDDLHGHEPNRPRRDGARPASSGRVAAPRRTHRRGLIVALAVAALLLAGGITGGYLWAGSRYFVGADNGAVVVFRGLDGSLLGWRFASVQENSCAAGAGAGANTANRCVPLQLDDLQQGARIQVRSGITVGNLDDARGVMDRLVFQLLPLCSPPPPPPGRSSAPPGGTSGVTEPSGNGAELPGPRASPSAATPSAATPSAAAPTSAAPTSSAPAASSRVVAPPGASARPTPSRAAPASNRPPAASPRPGPPQSRPAGSTRPAVPPVPPATPGAPAPARPGQRPQLTVTATVTTVITAGDTPVAGSSPAAGTGPIAFAAPASPGPATRTPVPAPARSAPAQSAPARSAPARSAPAPSAGRASAAQLPPTTITATLTRTVTPARTPSPSPTASATPTPTPGTTLTDSQEPGVTCRSVR